MYKAAGKERLLAERQKIGHIKPGDVAITPAFKLDAKYIIHASGPWWEGGSKGEVNFRLTFLLFG
ncbi:macro domain-containing protein [Lachnospiraceae bacterium C1.1]|nr:macro domain-containing protein [Lachnospiraceae bacterium C1.1]